jgi:O-antigen ligase
MTKMEIHLDSSASKPLAVLENVILAVCLCILALRTTFTEGALTHSADQPLGLGETVYTLVISMLLMALFIIWLVWSFAGRRLAYRFSGIEVGLAVFAVAAALSGSTAANKRAAIESITTLVAPVVMAVMLVQILDRPSRVRLVLTCIAALGLLSAYQCSEQFFYTNKMMIQQYQQDPQSLLGLLGIEPNSFAQMLLEHRLYSRGIHGYFTTSNSAGSFALLASFAALGLFADALANRKSDTSATARLVIGGAASAAVVGGLLITASKGAIIAFFVAAVMFLAYIFLGNRLQAHRKTFFLLVLLAAAAGAIAVAGYGLTHHRLPGGNSMLVRWQYWEASVRMYADHAIWGVGPGNFVHYYPRYKIPAALETVADPHNFVLSILTQYGPVGLVGFLAMLAVGLWKVVFAAPRGPLPSLENISRLHKTLAALVFAGVCAAMLVVRPMILKIPEGASAQEKQAASVILYVVPTIIFAAGVVFFVFGQIRGTKSDSSVIIGALFCGIVGVLLHNLIDFAIFEPGVLTTLWVTMACMVGLNLHQNIVKPAVIRPAWTVRVVVISLCAALTWACANYVLIPVVNSTRKTGAAERDFAAKRYDAAHKLLAEAAGADQLDASISALDGRMYVEQYKMEGKDDKQLLFGAENRLAEAATRNKADFKNYERLSEVYVLLAQDTAEPKLREYLQKALESATGAIKLYPCCGRLHLEAAKTAERLGLMKDALSHYRATIKDEDEYREMFRRMYPGQEVFSRLGQDKYDFAKAREKELSKAVNP